MQFTTQRTAMNTSLLFVQLTIEVVFAGLMYLLMSRLYWDAVPREVWLPAWLLAGPAKYWLVVVLLLYGVWLVIGLRVSDREVFRLLFRKLLVIGIILLCTTTLQTVLFIYAVLEVATVLLTSFIMLLVTLYRQRSVVVSVVWGIIAIVLLLWGLYLSVFGLVVFVLVDQSYSSIPLLVGLWAVGLLLLLYDKKSNTCRSFGVSSATFMNLLIFK